MADRPSWWEYVKAAFRFRFPLRALGAVPVNHILLGVGAFFAVVLWLVAHLPLAALGVVFLTLAYEVLYLSLLTSLPRFRAMVRADLSAAGQAAVSRTDQARQRQLSAPSRKRLDALVSACAEAEQRLAENLGDDQAALGDVLKTGGFADLQRLFVMLLAHRERLADYLARPAVKALPEQIGRLERALAKGDQTEAVTQSWRGTLEILRQRERQRVRACEEYELCEAELLRIEQQVELLRERALVAHDVSGIADQLDQVVQGLNETTDWLVESERMLGEPESEIEVRVDA